MGSIYATITVCLCIPYLCEGTAQRSITIAEAERVRSTHPPGWNCDCYSDMNVDVNAMNVGDSQNLNFSFSCNPLLQPHIPREEEPQRLMEMDNFVKQRVMVMLLMSVFGICCDTMDHLYEIGASLRKRMRGRENEKKERNKRRS